MQSHRSTYSINFADETAMVELFVLVEFKYMVVVNYVAIAAALIMFLIVYSNFIRYKVRYITELEKEVNILEAGDMNYKLTVKGNDELSYLARSIDNMRLSVNERRAEEEKARLANHKLVTAMSHDLRTPLTILIGLLEIIDGKKYSGEEELNTYITKTKNKAYQIKELSDKIFEYFFAFDIKESELNKEPYDTEIVNAMLEDYNFNLTDKGYIVNYTPCDVTARVMLDVKVFGRVFGNIFSNILKYADKTKDVDICCRVENEELVITASNYVLPKNHAEESTNIGLEVCKNIVKQHSGSFNSEEADGVFNVTVKLPIVQ
jgi:signal transduction histidine kinase